MASNYPESLRHVVVCTALDTARTLGLAAPLIVARKASVPAVRYFELSGMAAFTGPDLTGILAVSGTLSFLGHTYPIKDRTLEELRTRDWLGELSNRFVGVFKSHLVARQKNVQVSLPQVLPLSQVTQTCATIGAIDTFAFGNDDIGFALHFCCRLSPTFDLSGPEDPSTLIGGPGAMVVW